jgi:hypothetical protein
MNKGDQIIQSVADKKELPLNKETQTLISYHLGKSKYE